MPPRSARLVTLACGLLLAGCGGSGPPPRALPGVQLRIDAPAEAGTTDTDTVEVRGTVSPAGATVLVEGDEAEVHGGTFSHTVAVGPGPNVVDVVAGAPRRPAAMTALRVVREVPVEVPDVAGQAPDDARRTLERAGLAVKLTRGGGLFDEIIPGEVGACGTTPGAGERVRAGSQVVVEVRKSC